MTALEFNAGLFMVHIDLGNDSSVEDNFDTPMIEDL